MISLNDALGILKRRIDMGASYSETIDYVVGKYNLSEELKADLESEYDKIFIQPRLRK